MLSPPIRSALLAALLVACSSFTVALDAADPVAPAAQKLFAVQFTLGPAWGTETNPPNAVLFKGHSDNLARLRNAGRVISGGLYGDKGIVLLLAASEAAALAEFEHDPAVGAKLFTITAAEFKPFYHGSTGTPSSPEVALLRRFLDALNRTDLEALLNTITPDFAWMTYQDDELLVDANGAENVREWVGNYFRTFQNVRTDFRTIEQLGNQLFVRERVSWDGAEGKRVSQQAFGVFLVESARLRRAVYFRSVPDAAPWTGQPFADPH